MQRSRLKNIANKSKEIMKPVVGEFEQFKNSLPIEIDDNYRLEAAWKAYGKPKNYQEALWEGLVQPLDDKTFKMPSIGYNEETEEYEYLNKGKENETVNRDIRVWDNDVIPFVKELKQGGYIRIYNDEKDCWTYSKNKLQETENKEIHESQEVEAFKQGGQMNVIPEGALHARKNNMDLAKEGEVTHKGIPVIDNDGEQVAEIEKEEIIFCKRVTDKIESAYKKFNSDESSQNDKDELAIQIGKFLTKVDLLNFFFPLIKSFLFSFKFNSVNILLLSIFLSGFTIRFSSSK